MADERSGYNEATRLPAFGAPEEPAEASQRPEPAPVSGDDELLKAKALVIEADQELPAPLQPNLFPTMPFLTLLGCNIPAGIC
ncbi:hypothetical protein AK812_SmicGene4372 [Symbiodinium microadriaticum]|uniref:Uncharacterized protein n=1 Tax=Symbiodinium microadriaticum TaxID=2951 RepID=A0A1Q9EWL2_SYMMI|nr:hypothetical protein AK812_SmicGene4372 [Symbiodinium microadriaticum]